VDILGSSRSDVAASATSWGRGSSKTKAQTREAENTCRVEQATDSGRLSLVSNNRMYSRAGVDFYVDTPFLMNTDIYVESGHVELRSLDGFQLVTASSVDAQDLYGSADLLAEGGSFDVSIVPESFGTVRVEARSGGGTLALPYGLPYDLTVRGDPEYTMTIADLGFQEIAEDAGFFAGFSGDDSVQIEVIVTGGSFTLVELF